MLNRVVYLALHTRADRNCKGRSTFVCSAACLGFELTRKSLLRFGSCDKWLILSGHCIARLGNLQSGLKMSLKQGDSGEFSNFPTDRIIRSQAWVVLENCAIEL